MSASGHLAGRCLFIAVAACAGLNSGCLIVPFGETTYADPTLHINTKTTFADPRWRSFPVAEENSPNPAPTPTALTPAPVQKTPEKMVEPPAPPPKPSISGRFATPSTAVVRTEKDLVPVPHPASVGGRTAPKNEKGFASLRAEPAAVESQTAVVPAKAEPTPSRIRPPVVDPGIRQIQGEDEVMRPEWPKLPAAKK